MPFLPDTNVWISILKNPGGELEKRVQSHTPGEIFFCSVVKAELWHGANKYERRERRLAVLTKLLRNLLRYHSMTKPHCTMRTSGTNWNFAVK